MARGNRGTARDRAALWWLVVPVLCIGLFSRVYFTPDEPREAALAFAMAHQQQHAVPEFGGEYFMEKPPLLYWLAGASAALFGPAPAALRLPGFLYALTAVAAMALVARRAAGQRAAFVTGICTATLLVTYQVEIWLATDAPLLAGVAVALCGLYVGFTARSADARLGGYATFHAGLLIAFFAKNVAGWMVPVLAFLCLIVSERRWRELVRRELWLPVPVLLAAIAAWTLSVASLPQGAEALRVFFWNNLVGRAVDVGDHGPYGYTAGHQNSPGKYLIELPVYLLPWTGIVLAALVTSLRAARGATGSGTAWRLGLGAVVPATLLLSVAATARGVYYGPPALGFALLAGLWAGALPEVPDRTARRWLAVTAATIALLALVIGGLAAVAAVAPRSRAADTLVLGLVALGGAVMAAVMAGRAPGAPSTDQALYRLAAATCLLFTLCAGPLYLSLNPWLDLGRVATRLSTVAGGPVQLVAPDETTEAMAELYLPHRADAASAPEIVWPLVQVADRRSWKVRDWQVFLGYRPSPGATAPPVLPPRAGYRPACVLERPGGRTYALYGPVAAVGSASASRCRAAMGEVPADDGAG